MKTISIAALLLGLLSPALVASPVPQEAPASNQAVFNLLYEMIAQQADGMADVIERGNTPESHEEMSLVIPRFWKSVDLSRMPASLYPYMRERQLLAERYVSFFGRYPDAGDDVACLIRNNEMMLRMILGTCYMKESAVFGDLWIFGLIISKIPYIDEGYVDTLDQPQRDALIQKIRAVAAAQRAKVKPMAQAAPPLHMAEQRALSLYALRHSLCRLEVQVKLYREGKDEEGDVLFKAYHEAQRATPLDGLATRMQEYIKAQQEAEETKNDALFDRVREKYELEWRQVRYAMMRVVFDCATMSPETAREVYGSSLILSPEDKAHLPDRIKLIESMMQMLRERIARLEADMKS